jgi:hypothetical protein
MDSLTNHNDVECENMVHLRNAKQSIDQFETMSGEELQIRREIYVRIELLLKMQ